MTPRDPQLVLVVDDDVDIRDALKDLLSDEGYRIAEAADGGAALDYLAANPLPSLILLDWNMAPVNGAQFMDEFIKRPIAARVPVVLVTADARVQHDPSDRRFAAQLRKPVPLDKLFAVIHDLSRCVS